MGRAEWTLRGNQQAHLRYLAVSSWRQVNCHYSLSRLILPLFLFTIDSIRCTTLDSVPPFRTCSHKLSSKYLPCLVRRPHNNVFRNPFVCKHGCSHPKRRSSTVVMHSISDSLISFHWVAVNFSRCQSRWKAPFATH